jgi:hypothetical protein
MRLFTGQAPVQIRSADNQIFKTAWIGCQAKTYVKRHALGMVKWFNVESRQGVKR